MTRIELIQLIGGLLTELDVLRGSLLPNDPNRPELDGLRKRLDEWQLQLSQNEFNDNTEEFLQATARLEPIVKDLRKTLNNIQELAATLQTLKRLTIAVNDVVNVAGAFGVGPTQPL